MKELIAALALTLLAQAAAVLTLYTPAVLAPAAQADIGIAASTIGLFTAIVFAMATWCAPFGSTFVARLGPMRVSQCCLVSCGCGLALCALASPAAVVVGAALIGAGIGPLTPASTEILASQAPPRVRNLVMSIRQSGVTLGGALAVAVAPLLLIAVGWKGAVLAIGAFCLCFAGALQAVRHRYDGAREISVSTQRPSPVRLFRMVYSHPELRQNALASFTYAGMQYCLSTFLVVFLVERAALSLPHAGWALACAMTAGLVGRILWGLVADWIGNTRKVLGALGLVMTISAFTLSQVTPGWPLAAILVLSTVFGATAIGWNGICVAEIARVAPPGQVAIATGGSLIFTYSGITIAPSLFWIVITVTGSYAWAFALLGVAALSVPLLLPERARVRRGRAAAAWSARRAPQWPCRSMRNPRACPAHRDIAISRLLHPR